MERRRDWFYTLNNYTDEDVTRIRKLEVTWQVIGFEVGESGTPHLQGYIYFKNARSFKAVKKLIGDRAHIEVPKTGTKTCSEYCMKDGKFETHGEMPGCRADAGKREQARWKEAWAAAKEQRLDDIPEDIKYRYYANTRRIMEDHAPKPEILRRDEQSKYGLWIHGKPGVGKSTYVMDKYPGAYLKDKNKWWNSYKGEKVVFIDEMDHKDHWMADTLKVWANAIPFPAEYKGGQQQIRPKLIVITSNFTMDEIFANVPSITMEALRRRFDEKEFTIDQRLSTQ